MFKKKVLISFSLTHHPLFVINRKTHRIIQMTREERDALFGAHELNEHGISKRYHAHLFLTRTFICCHHQAHKQKED